MMRSFSLTVAFLALVGGVGCIAIVSKLKRVYEELGAPLSVLAKLLVNTSGWIPGGVLVGLAFLVVILVTTGKLRASLYLSVVTLLLLIGAGIALPVVLMAPISKIVQEIDSAAVHKVQEPSHPGIFHSTERFI